MRAAAAGAAAAVVAAAEGGADGRGRWSPTRMWGRFAGVGRHNHAETGPCTVPEDIDKLLCIALSLTFGSVQAKPTSLN